MADDLLRFRCFQCNKLLGAPVRKAGKTITCPNCKADLIVPTPSTDPPLEDAIRALTPNVDESAHINQPSSPRHDPGFSWEEIDASIFEGPEVLTSNDLPPIDLESAPAIETAEYTLPRFDKPVPSLSTEASSPPLDFIAPPENLADSTSSSPVDFKFAPVDPRVDVLLIPPVSPTAQAIPDLTVETPTVSAAPKLAPASRRRDGNVVLAQSVLISWSLFVVLALAISFVAGLLVGHFFWKN